MQIFCFCVHRQNILTIYVYSVRFTQYNAVTTCSAHWVPHTVKLQHSTVTAVNNVVFAICCYPSYMFETTENLFSIWFTYVNCIQFVWSICVLFTAGIVCFITQSTNSIFLFCVLHPMHHCKQLFWRQ